MAGRPANRVNVNVSTSGTGSPFTCGSAISGFQGLSVLQVGDIVEYSISDGTNWEDGWGVVGGSPSTITRNVFDSSSSGAAISLSGSATCIVTLTAQGAAAILGLVTQRIGGGI